MGNLNNKAISGGEQNMEKDVVCGMDVDEAGKRVLKATRNGAEYYFCSKVCKLAFEKHPNKFTR